LHTVPKRYGRTDGQLTVASPRSALASRGKKHDQHWWFCFIYFEILQSNV